MRGQYQYCCSLARQESLEKRQYVISAGPKYQNAVNFPLTTQTIHFQNLLYSLRNEKRLRNIYSFLRLKKFINNDLTPPSRVNYPEKMYEIL